MEQLKESLSKAFLGFSYTVNDGKSIAVSYAWNITSFGIEGVRITLRGINSLTGEEISDQEVAVLSPATQHKVSRNFPYDGKYTMHFSAIDKQGNVVCEDFRRPETVILKNTAKCPRIEYSVSPAKRGWSKLTISTNCARRCREKLWAVYDERHNLLPPLKDGETTLYIPSQRQGVRLVMDMDGCEDIQAPVKI